MPTALKGAWEVQAGVLPGTPMPELTRRWAYISEHYEEDAKKEDYEMTEFTSMMYRAHEYAQSLTNPSAVNWVRVDFIWY